MQTPYTSDIEYLNDELNWIHARAKRIRIEMQLQNKEDLRAEHRKALPEDCEKLYHEESSCRDEIDYRLSLGGTLRFHAVCKSYALSKLEEKILLVALVCTYSRKHEKAICRLGSEFGTLDIGSVFAFLGLTHIDRLRCRKVFSKRSPLLSNDLIQLEAGHRFQSNSDIFQATIQISGQLFHHILNLEDIFDDFEEFSSLETPKTTMSQVVLPPEDKQNILSIVENRDEYLRMREEWGFDNIITYGRGTFLLFCGEPGTGKTMTAHGIASHLNCKVLNVDIPTFIESHDAQRFLPSLFREAKLRNAILFFDECETIFASRRMGNNIMTMLLTEMERFEGIAILATNLPEVLDDALERRIMLKVKFKKPDIGERLKIWKQHIPPQAPISSDVNLLELAARFDITGGYIKNAILMALAEVVREKSTSIHQRHLMKAAQVQCTFNMKGERLTRPNVPLQNVILNRGTDRQVKGLVKAIQNHRTVMETWGLGKQMSTGKGLSALFHGPPGVGKSHTAEAIAHELNRPLLLADSGTLLSKYVGESEKAVRSLFKQAENSNAILFIDEADTFLTHREQQANHQVSLVNTFLVLLERHNGVVILATNRIQSLDS
ncbi:MAG: AAA family ATPase, partial [Myxococcota bacterium]|nr:AAA family ATPase [Myxococcota bacterium]